MNATEYAISRDVRNSLIVREVDEARQRQLWRQVAVAIVFVAVAVVAAWPHFALIDYEYRTARLQRDRAAEEAITRQLRLDIEKLESPKRIEELALGRLHMVMPPGEVVVLERIVPADPPPSSIVASR